jgi:hypothetical protein
MKAVRRKQHSLWLAVIPFRMLNSRRFGHKVKAENKINTEDDDLDKCCSTKVPFDPTAKDSRIYVVQSQLFDLRELAEWINWRQPLSEMIKMNGNKKDWDMHGMLAFALWKGKPADCYGN